LAKFIEKIALKLLERYKQPLKKEQLRSFDNSSDIGVVYNVKNTSISTINKVKEYFSSNEKNVITMGFLPEKELGEYVSNYKDEYICKKDLNLFGLPKRDKIQKFINKDFDYLLNLDVEGNLQLQAISAYSKAKTRIGKYWDAFHFSQDFMVKSVAGTAEDLFQDMKKYIK